MGRPRKSRDGKQQYTSEDLQEAVEKVRNKELTISEASRRYDIPRSTVNFYVKGANYTYKKPVSTDEEDYTQQLPVKVERIEDVMNYVKEGHVQEYMLSGEGEPASSVCSQESPRRSQHPVPIKQELIRLVNSAPPNVMSENSAVTVLGEISASQQLATITDPLLSPRPEIECAEVVIANQRPIYTTEEDSDSSSAKSELSSTPPESEDESDTLDTPASQVEETEVISFLRKRVLELNRLSQGEVSTVPDHSKSQFNSQDSEIAKSRLKRELARRESSSEPQSPDAKSRKIISPQKNSQPRAGRKPSKRTPVKSEQVNSQPRAGRKPSKTTPVKSEQVNSQPRARRKPSKTTPVKKANTGKPLRGRSHSLPAENTRATSPVQTLENIVTKAREEINHSATADTVSSSSPSVSEPTDVADSNVKNSREKMKRYSREDLIEACRRVNDNEISLGQAFQLYNIPKSTIASHIKDQTLGHKGDAQRQLSFEMEEELLKYLEYCSDHNFPLARKYTSRAIIYLMKRSSPEHIRFNLDRGPSSHWFQMFEKKHAHIKWEQQHVADTRAVMLERFTNFYEVVLFNNNLSTSSKAEKWNPATSAPLIYMYNMEECDLSGAAATGEAQAEQSQQNKQQVSVLSCVSASGQVMPSMVIFQKETFQPSVKQQRLPPHWLMAVTPTGSVDPDLFTLWLSRCFIPHCCGERRAGRKAILLVDNQNYHLSLDTVQLAETQHISIIGFPSQLFDSIDVFVFRRVKQEFMTLYSTAIQESTEVNSLDLPHLWDKAMKKEADREKCVLSFMKSGFYPFDAMALDPKHVLRPPKRSEQCLVCGESLTTFRRHQCRPEARQGDKVHMCPVCGREFSQASQLRRHHTIHTGIRPHKCSYCQKTFRHRENMKKHERIHTGERPHPCSLCEKRFQSRGHVARHMRVHTGERPYKCSVCLKAFQQSNDLKRHVLTHSKVKPYTCNVCQKGFTLSNHLKLHSQIHEKQIQVYF